MEVGIIEREEWRSVETSSGGESVMMPGMKMMLLLHAGNLDFRKKVSKFSVNIACSTISDSGAEAIINIMESAPDLDPSTLSFFALDDVGCNGSERNLLDCLPKHNCITTAGEEILLAYSAYVKVWKIKLTAADKNYVFSLACFRS